MIRRSLLACLSVITLSTAAFGAAITVTMDSGSFILQSNLGVTLSGGSSLDGNGTVIQLGYYTGGTNLNPFLGTWVPLTGNGSANTASVSLDNSVSLALNQTSVGDLNANGPSNGQFGLQVGFETTDSTRNQGLGGLIAGSTPLVIRFYNATTVASATFYNAVSAGALWYWAAPAASPNPPAALTISFDDPGLVAEDPSGVSGANIRTTLAVVPEPSSFALALVGVVGLATARRRRAA